jgi:hypothetical protein
MMLSIFRKYDKDKQVVLGGINLIRDKKNGCRL